MQEPTVDVIALSGRLDLRNRLCTLHCQRKFMLLVLTDHYSISSLGERLLRLEKAVSAPYTYDEQIRSITISGITDTMVQP
jgi:hypothetical protein